MIANLYELNEVINAVANRALDIVAETSTSGQRYVDHSDVADLISKEDFLKYSDLIISELNTREELLAPAELDDGQLDLTMGLAYCKAYEWCEGDERVFGCSYEEWLEREAEPVTHTLSLSRMAEIGHSAVAHILESSDKALEDLTECVGMSLEEVNSIAAPTISEDSPEESFGIDIVYEEKHEPIEFYVGCSLFEIPDKFSDFDAALERYQNIEPGIEKNISFIVYDEQGRGHGAILLMNSGKGTDRPCRLGEESLENPHIALAYAKSVISCYPFDEKAWNLRTEAERKLGITDRIVDISNDLLVSNWRVHIIPTGGRYGRHNTLINEGKPLVEFYDMNCIDEQHSPNGLFTGSRYYVDTILGKDAVSNCPYSSGLSLNYECPAWVVSAKDMSEVISYLKTYEKGTVEKSSLSDKIAQAEEKRGVAAVGISAGKGQER